jgi:hypothetical protein
MLVKSVSVGGKNNIMFCWTSCVLIRVEEADRGRRGRDHMVVGFMTTYVISVYYH